jgi:hypothetical protein
VRANTSLGRLSRASDEGRDKRLSPKPRRQRGRHVPVASTAPSSRRDEGHSTDADALGPPRAAPPAGLRGMASTRWTISRCAARHRQALDEGEPVDLLLQALSGCPSCNAAFGITPPFPHLHPNHLSSPSLFRLPPSLPLPPLSAPAATSPMLLQSPRSTRNRVVLLLEVPKDRARVDAEVARRLRPVAVVPLEHFEHVAALEVFFRLF